MTTTPTLLVGSLWRGWGLTGALVLLALATTAAVLGPGSVNLPRVGALGQITSPLTSFCSWLVVLAALRTAHEPSFDLFCTAPRVNVARNLTRVGAVAGLGVLLLMAAPGGDATSVLNTTTALLGEGLACCALAGTTTSWLLPSLHLMAAAVMGAVNRRDLSAWAWILEADPSGAHLTVSVSLAAAGAVLWATRAQKRPLVGALRE